MKESCLTWHDVLIRKGIEPTVAKSMIGFISWNKDGKLPKLGEEITDVLIDYEGKVYARDVISDNYNHIGILFFSRDIPGDTSNQIFSIIINYEQEEVYELHSYHGYLKP